MVGPAGPIVGGLVRERSEVALSNPLASQLSISDVVSDPLELFVVDVGAMQEGVASYELLVERYHTIVTGFEPNTEQLSFLPRDARRRYLPHVLGQGGQATFYETS